MSNEKFTQGEWYSVCAEVLCYDESSLQPSLAINLSGCCDSSEEVLNAHIISAAPDMYRALRNVVCSPSERRGDIVQVALTQVEVDAIRAALAKADGEQQQ